MPRLGAPGKTRILVVGDLCPDIVVGGVPTRGPALRFGQAEDLVASTSITLGSSAGITACAAAEYLPVSLVAVVGTDDLGALCLRWLGERDVDTTHVRLSRTAPTGCSVILVRADEPDDRQILTALGALAELSVDDVTEGALDSANHLHVSSFFLHSAAREELWRVMARARDRGLTVSLDTNDDPERAWRSGAAQALEQADVLFCNDLEAAGLAGVDPERSDVAPDLLLNRLAVRGDDDARYPAVVRKRGGSGATAYTSEGTVSVTAPDVAVVDTVGAGDTLAGTCLALLAAGADWPQALAHGVAAGSLSTTGVGGVSARPSPARVADLAATLRVTDHRPKEAHRDRLT